MTAAAGQVFLHPTPRDKVLRRRYGSLRWRRLSTMVRTRDGQCLVRVSKRCSGRAEVADHIIRPEEGGEMYDASNLRASCRSCNFTRHNAAYFREKVDAAAAGRPVPTESPRLMPERRSGRPSSGDPKFREWLMSLHGVGGEPTDHGHGRWDVAPIVTTRDAGSFRVCPDSCTSPVRWPA